MDNIIPVIIWIGIIVVINVVKAATKKQKSPPVALPRPMHTHEPAEQPGPPFRQPAAPPVEELSEKEDDDAEPVLTSGTDEAPEEVAEWIRELFEEAKSGQAKPEPLPVQQEGSHAEPMGAPHVSELRDAKAPAIAHMEGHIGEAHGAERHPDSQTALRMLKKKPTIRFSHSPRRMREAIILSEVLARPRAYKL